MSRARRAPSGHSAVTAEMAILVTVPHLRNLKVWVATPSCPQPRRCSCRSPVSPSLCDRKHWETSWHPNLDASWVCPGHVLGSGVRSQRPPLGQGLQAQLRQSATLFSSVFQAEPSASRSASERQPTCPQQRSVTCSDREHAWGPGYSRSLRAPAIYSKKHRQTYPLLIAPLHCIDFYIRNRPAFRVSPDNGLLRLD